MLSVQPSDEPNQRPRILLKSSDTQIETIIPNGEELLCWNGASVLIPEKQTIPVREGTHLQVVLPINTRGQLPVMYLEPRQILTAYMVAIATAKQLVLDPRSRNQHVNVDMRTVKPSFENEKSGRYSSLVIEIYGRKIKGKHFGEPAPTLHNHWEGNRTINAADRDHLKNYVAPKILAQLYEYKGLDLFAHVDTVPHLETDGILTLWKGGRYKLVVDPIPLLDPQDHGFHFVLRNTPEDLRSVWYDPAKTLEMISIGLGVGRFLKQNGYTVNDAFYDINMNWGIFWRYFRKSREDSEKLKELRKKLRATFIEKVKAVRKMTRELGKEQGRTFNITQIYMEALLSLEPTSVHLHNQFTKALWEIPNTPESFRTHRPLPKTEREHIQELLSGKLLGTGKDPLSTWVVRNCSGRIPN